MKHHIINLLTVPFFGFNNQVAKKIKKNENNTYFMKYRLSRNRS